MHVLGSRDILADLRWKLSYYGITRRWRIVVLRSQLRRALK